MNPREPDGNGDSHWHTDCFIVAELPDFRDEGCNMQVQPFGEMTDCPRTALIVDDDVSTLEVLCQVLGRDQYECLAATDGLAALELAREHAIGFALLDYELPDMNGVELLRELKKLRPNVPVALMTGNPSQQILFEAMEAGACTFLAKPLNLQQLRGIIGKAFSGETRYHVSMSQMEVKRSSTFVRWSRWIIKNRD